MGSVPDFIPTAAIIAALLLLVRWLYREFGARWYTRVLVGVGCVLLVCATLMSALHYFEVFPPNSVFNNPELRVIAEDLIGVPGGFILVALGLLTIAPRLTRQDGEAAPPEPKRSRAGHVAPSSPPLSQDFHLAQEMLNGVLKSSMTGVMILKCIRDESRSVSDFDCRIANGAVEQLLGRSSAELHGPGLLEKLPCLRKSDLLGEALGVLESGLPLRCERSFTQGLITTWFQIVAVRLGDGLVVNFADISDRKRTEEQLRHDASHDALTGLPNRACFVTRLREAIMRAKRYTHYSFAVLFLDFDRFKVINDSLGHDVGDQLLTGIAERLRANLRNLDLASRSTERHVPARLGGDEFVILLDGVEEPRDAVAIAERLQRELSTPYVIGDNEIVSTASIGIVFSHGDYDQPDDILRDADTAMYEAKRGGKARHVVFDPRMHEDALAQLELEADLREAVDQQAFTIQYEPIECLNTGELIGVEARLVWLHKSRGPLTADEFLPLATELRLDDQICEWALHQACQHAQQWVRYAEDGGLRVHLNLVPRLLLATELPTIVDDALRSAGVPDSILALEVTPAMADHQPEVVRPLLDQLRQRGVHIVVDAFGTAASPLECIQRVPADAIKVDAAFINQMEHRRAQQAIAQAMHVMARELNLRMLAEGVENEQQEQMLRQLGCDAAQGQWIGPAVSADGVVAWLRDGRARRVA